jgi:hypothetical protein
VNPALIQILIQLGIDVAGVIQKRRNGSGNDAVALIGELETLYEKARAAAAAEGVELEQLLEEAARQNAQSIFDVVGGSSPAPQPSDDPYAREWPSDPTQIDEAKALYHRGDEAWQIPDGTQPSGSRFVVMQAGIGIGKMPTGAVMLGKF